MDICINKALLLKACVQLKWNWNETEQITGERVLKQIWNTKTVLKQIWNTERDLKQLWNSSETVKEARWLANSSLFLFQTCFRSVSGLFLFLFPSCFISVSFQLCAHLKQVLTTQSLLHIVRWGPGRVVFCHQAEDSSPCNSLFGSCWMTTVARRGRRGSVSIALLCRAIVASIACKTHDNTESTARKHLGSNFQHQSDYAKAFYDHGHIT